MRNRWVGPAETREQHKWRAMPAVVDVVQTYTVRIEKGFLHPTQNSHLTCSSSDWEYTVYRGARRPVGLIMGNDVTSIMHDNASIRYEVSLAAVGFRDGRGRLAVAGRRWSP